MGPLLPNMRAETFARYFGKGEERITMIKQLFWREQNIYRSTNISVYIYTHTYIQICVFYFM